MASNYYWWEKNQNGPGDNPFLSGGGGGQNPFLPLSGNASQTANQQRITDAQRESANLTAKENALGMAPVDEPSIWSKAGMGALGALNWLFTPIRKATNALAGGLEEARNFNSYGGTNTQSAAQGWSDPFGELKAAGRGISQGWNEDKQYSFGRYIGDMSSDVTGQGRGQGFAPVRFLEALGTDQDKKAGKSAWEYAHTAYGPAPEGTALKERLKNSTLSDILGFGVEAKLGDNLVPIKMGRVKVAGEVTGLAKPATYRIANKGEQVLEEIMQASKVPMKTIELPSLVDEVSNPVVDAAKIKPWDIASLPHLTKEVKPWDTASLPRITKQVKPWDISALPRAMPTQGYPVSLEATDTLSMLNTPVQNAAMDVAPVVKPWNTASLPRITKQIKPWDISRLPHLSTAPKGAQTLDLVSGAPTLSRAEAGFQNAILANNWAEDPELIRALSSLADESVKEVIPTGAEAVTRVTREAAKRGFNSADELFDFASKTPSEQFRKLGSRANMKSGFFGIPENAQTLARSASGSTMSYAPDQLRRVAQVWDPIRGWTTPMLESQLRYGDQLAAAGRAGLGMLPQGAQDVLGAVFRNMETSSTPQVRAMNEAIDATKQGARTGVRNTQERLFQAIDELAPNITDNERRALYYAVAMGKQLDDPEFLAQLSTTLKIPPAELQSLSRLKGFRDFIDMEFRGFKTKGEAAGLFKGIEDPYAPIFGKQIGLGGESSTTQAMRQRMGGLRSIQKMRDTDIENLLNQSEHLATDDIVEAMLRYNKTFHNIERTKNLTDMLQQLGIVSTENKAGYDTLADVIRFGPDGKDAQRLFIDKAYKGRLANEELGFLRDSPMAQGLKKVEDITRPWKTVVTQLNPGYHIRNTIDDFVRTNILGDGQMDNIAQTVTRETGDTVATGVRVRDWAKNAHGQWEYAPGADAIMDLTATDAKGLAQAMGVSRTQAQAIGANTTLTQRVHQGIKGKTGLDLKDPSQVAREAYFINGLKQQGSSDLARQIVNSDLIDYNDVSPLIRDVVRPLAPFSTFAFKNPSVAAESLLRNPGKFSQFDFLRNEVAGDPNLYQELPEYLRDQGVVAWRDDQGNVQTLNPGLSQFDWQNLAPAKALKASARLPHPVIQAILGLQRGVDSNGIPIDTAEGFGKKPVSGLASFLLPTEQGADGGQYASAQNKFLFDTFLSGPQAMSTMFSDPEKFVLRGMNKDFNEQELILQALLDENRRRTGRLKGHQQMGGQVPRMSELQSASINPFMSR